MTSQQPHLSHPKYRPDIDGLRAIAVLSVVAYHAFPSWVKGGFIGVDVFFVISGYLISTIIFENLEKGTFSFAEFYARRIKRIFPALLLVLIASYAFGWFALLADEYKQLGEHIVAGAGFVSNIVLWNEAGYFDNSAETKPLLHLWSLGIEEQFYIVWPLLLWFAWTRKFNLLTLTILVAIVSFYLNVKGIKKDAVATFYSPQTRFWELLCGSLLSWLTIYKKKAFATAKAKLDVWLASTLYREKPAADGKTLSNVLSFLGLFLLAYGFLRINKEFSFPGRWAIVPVLGAVLIISAGTKAWVNRTILSNRVVVWFGLISFPLYLWHWPLLSFARIVGSEVPGRKIRIVAVLVSIVLAWLTYRLVERPIRLGQHSKSMLTLLVVFMLAVGYMGYNSYSRDGLNFRDVVKINATLNSGADGGDEQNSIPDCGIEVDELKKLFAVCAKDKRGSVKYALLGDSKAASLYPGLVRTSTENGRWLFIGGNGPNGAPVPLLSSEPNFSQFQRLTSTAVSAIAGNKAIETVVLVTAVRAIFQLRDGVMGGNLATYNFKYMRGLSQTQNYNRTLEGLDQTINSFAKAGKKVVLVVDNPALPNPKDCVARSTSIAVVNALLNNKNEDCYVPLSEHNDLIKLYRKLLAELKDKHPSSVEIFDTTPLLCDEISGLCGPIHNGRLLYSYADHLSDYAAGRVGKELNAFLNK